MRWKNFPLYFLRGVSSHTHSITWETPCPYINHLVETQTLSFTFISVPATATHPQMPILTHHMSILYIPIRIYPFTFLLLLHACIPNDLNLIVFNCGFLKYPLYQSTGLNALMHSRHNQPLLSSLPTHTQESTCIYSQFVVPTLIVIATISYPILSFSLPVCGCCVFVLFV